MEDSEVIPSSQPPVTRRSDVQRSLQSSPGLPETRNEGQDVTEPPLEERSQSPFSPDNSGSSSGKGNESSDLSNEHKDSSENDESEDDSDSSSSNDEDNVLHVPRLKGRQPPKATWSDLESSEDESPRVRNYKRFRRVMMLKEPLQRNIDTAKLRYPDPDYLRPEENLKLNNKYMSKFHKKFPKYNNYY